MKKRHFDVETDGFYGAYWKCKSDSDCAMIAMIGDDSEDYLAALKMPEIHWIVELTHTKYLLYF